jgi:glycosyltransferase involved in cell wall biosynthesis
MAVSHDDRRQSERRPALVVLHVAEPTHAGVSNVAGSLVSDQCARSWRVSVAAPPDSELIDAARRVGAQVHSWRAVREPGRVVIDETRRLARVVARVRPDLVHLHSAKAGLAGRLAIRGAIPTVFQPHAWSFQAAAGLVFLASRSWERWAARWTDVILCVSADERDLGIREGIDARWAVIPNGVALDVFAPATPAERAQARRALGLPDGPVVLTVGRLSPQKGHDVLLRAWAHVRRASPEATLVLVGDGPDEPALRALAGPGVVFAGRRSDVGHWLAAADVVAIPSRWEAGLPLVAMEAMARGRPVVACDVAGVREGLGHGGGVVIPSEDPPALAHALLQRLTAPDLAAAEGSAGRRHVEAAHDVRVAAEHTANLYAEVLTRRGMSRPR